MHELQLWLAMLTSHIGLPIQALVTLLLIHLYDNVSSKALEDDSNTWAPDFQVGNLDAVPGS